MSSARLYVGITDGGWLDALRGHPDLDEVNFWRPGGGLLNTPRGTPFLFKLKAPINAIAGGGFFELAQQMTVREAWEFYGVKNGVFSLKELEGKISHYRGRSVTGDDKVGCIILDEPFFLPEKYRVRLPESWKSNTQSGRYYDLESAEGAELWSAVLPFAKRYSTISDPGVFGGVGTPSLYVPRRGQGTFRRLVLAAYGNRCSITGERTLPVVQASHIRPFADEQTHEVRNGLALRSDIHTLFDQGYVTVAPDHRFHVSKSIREEFENGREYYALNGREIRLPINPAQQPKDEYLDWHSSKLFKG